MPAVLDRKTLVLNRSWTPVTVTTARRAIVLMSRGAAGAVDPSTFELLFWEGWIGRGPQGGDVVHAVGFVFPIPEVIVLATYNDVPHWQVPYTRRNVYRRDGGRCQYCGQAPGLFHLTIDHVLPRSRGGRTSWENCVTACLECNAQKANRTVDEAGMRLRRRPTAPPWVGGMDPRTLSARPAWNRFVPQRLSATNGHDRAHNGHDHDRSIAPA